MRGRKIIAFCVFVALVLFPVLIASMGAGQPPVPVLAFGSTREGGLFQTFVVYANFTQTQLTSDPWYNARPNWSYDGRKIIFTAVKQTDGNGEIYVMNPDGSGQTNLTNNPADDQMSVWSPDDTRIAFVSDRDGLAQIYVMNADGSVQTRLSDGAGWDFMPSWSPDGTQIAFESYRDGHGQIYVMNANGSNPVNLTKSLSNDSNPSWSPRGDRIAFGSDRDHNGQDGNGNFNGEIYVMNADGSQQTRLTNNPANEYYPAWSPTGEQIAFVSNRSGNYQIYVMNTNGAAQIRVTHDDAYDADPTWFRALPRTTR